MILARLRLPFPISVNDMYAATGNKQPGKDRYPTKELKAWKNAAGLLLNTQHPPRITERVEVHIDLDDRRQGDCDSRIKCVLDILVKQGVLPDDRKKYVKRASIGWEQQAEECVVTIQRANEGLFNEADPVRCGEEGIS